MDKKYLKFEEILSKSKTRTKIFNIYSNDGYYTIGKIKYYFGWRKYCFYSPRLTIIDSTCLKEIIIFLDKLNKEHKERNK